MAECAMNGIITSPGYPRNYGNNINLTWLIQVPEGLKVEITFVSFELELASSFAGCRYVCTKRPDKIEMIFSSRRFLQKMNKRIQLYYYEICFCSFFWRKLKTPKRHFEIN